MLTAVIIVAVGTLAGGWLARHRPPPTSVQVLCGVIAIVASIVSAAWFDGTAAEEVFVALAAVVASILVIAGLHGWEGDLPRG